MDVDAKLISYVILPSITTEDNRLLLANPSNSEVKAAVFSMDPSRH